MWIEALERLLPLLYRQQPPSTVRRAAGALTNVKALALPAQWLYRLRRWARQQS